MKKKNNQKGFFSSLWEMLFPQKEGITIYTNKKSGEKIDLNIVVLDRNAATLKIKGVKEAVRPWDSGESRAYTLTGSKIRIIGDIEELSCVGQSVYKIVFSPDHMLKKLYCSKNKLRTLDISNIEKLELLDCSDNELKSIYVAQNRALRSLICSRNKLEKLHLGACAEIESIQAEENKLHHIFLNAPKLETLNVAQNKFKKLFLIKSTRLKSLICDHNLLEHLDLRKNPSLQVLKCNDNKLTTLYIEKNKRLRDVDYSNNNLNKATSKEGKAEVDAPRNRKTELRTKQNKPTQAKIGALSENLPSEGTSELVQKKDLQTTETNSPKRATRETFETAQELDRSRYIRIHIAGENTNKVNLRVSSYKSTPLEVEGIKGELSQGGKLNSYEIEGDTLTIYGMVYNIQCDDVSISNVEFVGQEELEAVSFCRTGITELELVDKKALRRVFCSENKLTKLNLQGSTKLVRIIAFGNNLTTLDLEGLNRLRELDIADNQFSSLSLATLESIKSLNCKANPIPSLSLKENKDLVKLNCANCGLTALDLPENVIFEELIVEGNPELEIPKDIPTLEDLSSITLYTNRLKGQTITLRVVSPDLAKCRIDGVEESLSEESATYTLVSQKITLFGDFTELECEKGTLSAVEFSQEQALQSLKLVNNQIKSIDLSLCSHLKEIDLSNNAFTSFTLSDTFQDLRAVSLERNRLATVDLSKAPILENVELGFNSIESICLPTENSKLKTLSIQVNKLNALDLSFAQSLEVLNIRENYLTELNLEGLTSLLYLDITRNPIEACSLKEQTALQKLYCVRTQLKSIDLSSCIHLNTLVCYGNQIEHLDLTQNRELEIVHCLSRDLTSLVLPEGIDSLVQIRCALDILLALDLPASLRSISLDDTAKNEEIMEQVIAKLPQVSEEEEATLLLNTYQREGEEEFAFSNAIVAKVQSKGWQVEVKVKENRKASFADRRRKQKRD